MAAPQAASVAVPPPAAAAADGAPSTAPSDLLSSDHSPIWLNPERFLEADFEPEACVADLRRFVPLATLQHELQQYLATLKTKMVEVINEDYADYVSLSSRLANVDGAVLRMRKPLVELRDKLVVVQEAVKAELTALNQGLRRRKEVATARSLLELMQDLAHVASKVEKLLAEVAAAQAGSGAPSSLGGPDLDTRARLLERVAGEVSRLTFQANRGKDLAFVRAMEPRISSARREVASHLAATLEAALGGRHAAAALHCLHAYAELGEPGPAEAMLRRVVVGPLVEKLVGEFKAAHPLRAGTGGDSGGGLSGLFTSLLNELGKELGPLLTAALAPQSPLRAFDLLGGVVLAEVDGALAAQLPGAFSPGVPPAFHANYLAAQAFLDALEGRCQARTALERLRGSAAWASFAKRWNTSVYFSLLYQEIAGELEDAISGLASAHGIAGHNAQGPANARLPPSVALVGGLGRVASRDVFLPQLADKFLRLALQLGQRYITWAAAVQTARREAVQAVQAAGGTPGTPGAGLGVPPGMGGGAGAAGEASGPGSEGSSALASPSGAGANALAWVKALPVEELGLVYQDVAAVGAYVLRFAPVFCGLLPGASGSAGASAGGHAHAHAEGGAKEAAQGALHDMASTVKAQAAGLLGCLVEEVVEACVAVVKQLKGITATYRMTTKGPPTRHSHYVTGVLAPLRALLDSPKLASCLDAGARGEVARNVVDAVSGRYQALAEELLTTVRKTESSLKRLKKTTTAAEGDASAMSDSDKITLQLYLDVQEYGNQVAKFGLEPSQLASFQKLQASVAPAAGVPVPAAPAPAAPAPTAAPVPAAPAPAPVHGGPPAFAAPLGPAGPVPGLQPPAGAPPTAIPPPAPSGSAGGMAPLPAGFAPAAAAGVPSSLGAMPAVGGARWSGSGTGPGSVGGAGNADVAGQEELL